MDSEQIRTRIKEIVASVADLEVSDIGDDAHFIDDLGLDSLSLLEIGVDIDYEFKLGVPEAELGKLRTIGDTVALVESRQAATEVA